MKKSDIKKCLELLSGDDEKRMIVDNYWNLKVLERFLRRKVKR